MQVLVMGWILELVLVLGLGQLLRQVLEHQEEMQRQLEGGLDRRRVWGRG